MTVTTGIQDLFPELLASIFGFLCLPPRELGPIALVCSRWSEIITNTSILWRDIRIMLDGSKAPTLTSSAIMFAELCFLRSKAAKLTLSITHRRIWRDNVLIPHLRHLLSHHAPRIQELEIKEFLGNDSLFPLGFDFPVLESVRIRCVNVARVNPDHMFSLPTNLKSLQVEGHFPRMQPTGSTCWPLSNINATSLQILKISTYGNNNDLDLDDLPRYSNLRHLELLGSAVPQTPAMVQPLRLPILVSLSFRDSSSSFCRYFAALSSLSHLTLSTGQPIPSTLPWPSMPRLTTLTGYRMHANDVLAIVNNCPMLMAIHYESLTGFVHFLDGLCHILRSSSRYQPSRLASGTPGNVGNLLEWLRLSNITPSSAVQYEPAMVVVSAAEKLLEVWSHGQLEMMTRPSNKPEARQWDEKELLEALDHFNIRSRVKVLVGSDESQEFGAPLHSEMF